MAVHHQLLVRTQIEEPAGGVVGTGAEGVPIGEELHGGGGAGVGYKVN